MPCNWCSSTALAPEQSTAFGKACAAPRTNVNRFAAVIDKARLATPIDNFVKIMLLTLESLHISG